MAAVAEGVGSPAAEVHSQETQSVELAFDREIRWVGPRTARAAAGELD